MARFGNELPEGSWNLITISRSYMHRLATSKSLPMSTQLLLNQPQRHRAFLTSVARTVFGGALFFAYGVATLAAQTPDVIFYDDEDPETRVELGRWAISPGTTVSIDVDGNLLVVPVDFDEAPVPPDPEPGEGPTISSFTVSPTEITAGQSTTVTLSWQTVEATSCSPTTGSFLSLNWQATELPNGSTTLTVPSTTSSGTRNFGLTCQNADGQATDQAALTIQESGDPDPDPPGPEDCPAPPSNFQRSTQIVCSSLTNCIPQTGGGPHTTWQSVFGQTFPASSKRSLYLQRNRYAALRFNSGSVTSAQLSAVLETFYQGAGGFGPYTASVSQCPGDFTEGLGRCRRISDGAWSVNATMIRVGTGFFDCELEPNTEYYFNLMFYDARDISNRAQCYQGVSTNCAGTFD